MTPLVTVNEFWSCTGQDVTVFPCAKPNANAEGRDVITTLVAEHGAHTDGSVTVPEIGPILPLDT
jgi:hypothetical protein